VRSGPSTVGGTGDEQGSTTVRGQHTRRDAACAQRATGLAAAEERPYHDWRFEIEDNGYLGGAAGNLVPVHATVGEDETVVGNSKTYDFIIDREANYRVHVEYDPGEGENVSGVCQQVTDFDMVLRHSNRTVLDSDTRTCEPGDLVVKGDGIHGPNLTSGSYQLEVWANNGFSEFDLLIDIDYFD